MEYKILQYQAKCTIPDLERKGIIKPKLWDDEGRIDTDYYHEDFGEYSDADEENALAHAIGAIDDLIKNPDDLDSKDRLCTDILNYFECIYSKRERKNAYHLVNVAAEALPLKDLANVIQKHIDRVELAATIDHDLIDIDQSLDFRKLYIKLGDRALFIDKDCDTAITFYGFVGHEWPIEDETINPRLHDESEELSGLSDAEIQAWQKKAELYRKILLGHTELDFSCLGLDNTKYDYQKLFHNIVESAASYDRELIPRTNILVERVGYEVKEANDISRLGQILIESVKRNYSVQILYSLSGEDDSYVEKYVDQIIFIITKIKGSRYRALLEWINRSTDEDKYKAKVILKGVEAVYYCEKVRENLKVEKGVSAESGYYTKYRTFALILPDNCKERNKPDECGMMSIMDVAYMNDPNEGLMLRRFLYSDNLPKEEEGRREAETPFVFIKCFTSMTDYLPMWQMYGDKGKGVCIVVDWSKVSGIDLYRVCYFNHTKNGYSLRREENKGINTKEVMRNLRQLRSIHAKLKKQEKRIIDSIIDPILYLFKDNSYSYEQEYRIMYTFDHNNKKMRHTPENPPKLFVLPPGLIQIKEIILGPKFENAVNLMPYLREQLEIMAEKTSTEPPKVTFSNIEFR